MKTIYVSISNSLSCNENGVMFYVSTLKFKNNIPASIDM